MKNLKRNVLIFLVPLIICIGCKSNTKTTSNTTETKQPNIIVILTDDMGYADLDIQGSLNDLKTPHLNDLEGMIQDIITLATQLIILQD